MTVREPVGFELLRRPRSREARHQHVRWNDLSAKAPKQLHDTGRNPVQVWHRVVGGNLHGNPLAADDLFQESMQLLPGRVVRHFRTNMAHRIGVDVVHDTGGAASRRQPQKQPATDHPAVSDESSCDWIEPAEIVDQPTIGTDVGQRTLEFPRVDPAERSHHSPALSGAGVPATPVITAGHADIVQHRALEIRDRP